MAKIITDLTTWILDFDDRIFRYVVYKKPGVAYPPARHEGDETQYESNGYHFGKIEEAIEVSDGKWMLGMRNILSPEVGLSDSLEYYMLDEIRLEFWGRDQDMLKSDEDLAPGHQRNPRQGFPEYKF